MSHEHDTHDISVWTAGAVYALNHLKTADSRAPWSAEHQRQLGTCLALTNHAPP